MGIFDQWPEYMPTASVVVTVSSGTLTLGASSVVNYGDYTWSPNQLRGTLWRNGNKVANLDINSSTGAITLASGVPVTNGDQIEVRIVFIGTASDPFIGRMNGRRSCTMTVAGDGSTTFDEDDTPVPVPTWDLAFGWDGVEKFKVGVMVSDDDDATEDMMVTTRLLGGALSKESSTAIDLSNTSTAQTHSSDFHLMDIEVAWEVEFSLASGASNPRVKDSIFMVFYEPTEVDSYPAAFPTSGTLLEVTKPGGYWSAMVDES